MRMLMVGIRKMGMAVALAVVVVRIISSMGVRVAVFQHAVVVGMGVAFGQMQCDAEQHQQARYHALRGQGLT